MVQKVNWITFFYSVHCKTTATVFYAYLQQLYKMIDIFTEYFLINFVQLNFGLPGESTSNPM